MPSGRNRRIDCKLGQPGLEGPQACSQSNREAEARLKVQRALGPDGHEGTAGRAVRACVERGQVWGRGICSAAAWMCPALPAAPAVWGRTPLGLVSQRVPCQVWLGVHGGVRLLAGRLREQFSRGADLKRLLARARTWSAVAGSPPGLLLRAEPENMEISIPRPFTHPGVGFARSPQREPSPPVRALGRTEEAWTSDLPPHTVGFASFFRAEDPLRFGRRL